MSVKCLMLETSDKRRLFTPLGGRSRLAECCRAFGTKMQVVRADLKRSQLLSIEKIVVALCEKGGKADDVEFEVVGAKKVRRAARSSRR